MIRTFLDAGVLIAATRMTGAMGVKALALFNEADRVFVARQSSSRRNAASPLFRISGLTITTFDSA